jgi:hypothetical protein
MMPMPIWPAQVTGGSDEDTAMRIKKPATVLEIDGADYGASIAAARPERAGQGLYRLHVHLHDLTPDQARHLRACARSAGSTGRPQSVALYVGDAVDGDTGPISLVGNVSIERLHLRQPPERSAERTGDVLWDARFTLEPIDGRARSLWERILEVGVIESALIVALLVGMLIVWWRHGP